MAPLPKRKHSTGRKGRRLLERQLESTFADLVDCPNCNKKKRPHRECKYCGQ